MLNFRILTPVGLLRAITRLQRDLDKHGPNDDWNDERKFLFLYVDLYKSLAKVEDVAPEYALRIGMINASNPLSERERGSIAKAGEIKKAIAREIRDLKKRRG